MSLPEQSEPLVDAVAHVVRQRDELLRRVEVLNSKLIDLSTPVDERLEVREMVRKAYRRGYLAGRSAARRGEPAVTNPERNARGWMRDVMEGRC